MGELRGGSAAVPVTGAAAGARGRARGLADGEQSARQPQQAPGHRPLPGSRFGGNGLAGYSGDGA